MQFLQAEFLWKKIFIAIINWSIFKSCLWLISDMTNMWHNMCQTWLMLSTEFKCNRAVIKAFTHSEMYLNKTKAGRDTFEYKTKLLKLLCWITSSKSVVTSSRGRDGGSTNSSQIFLFLPSSLFNLKLSCKHVQWAPLAWVQKPQVKSVCLHQNGHTHCLIMSTCNIILLLHDIS